MRIVLKRKNFDINNAIIGVKSTNNVMQEKIQTFIKCIILMNFTQHTAFQYCLNYPTLHHNSLR